MKSIKLSLLSFLIIVSASVFYGVLLGSVSQFLIGKVPIKHPLIFAIVGLAIAVFFFRHIYSSLHTGFFESEFGGSCKRASNPTEYWVEIITGLLIANTFLVIGIVCLFVYFIR